MNLLRFFSAIVLLLSAGVTSAGPALDYDVFDELLLQNVRNGFVDYDGLAADSRFAAFVEQIGDADAASVASGNEQLAYYINAYNALAIQGILENTSPRTLFGRYGFFKRKKYVVAGEKINLFDLERKRIIGTGETRIHFAIVCASLSCPRLSSRAYFPDTLDAQLHEAAKAFINDPTRNRFDFERKIAFVSMIFKWYSKEFENSGGSIQKYLARFVDDAKVGDALRLEEFELRFDKYDWNLNGRYTGAKK
jgi:hypothetical protein